MERRAFIGVVLLGTAAALAENNSAAVLASSLTPVVETPRIITTAPTYAQALNPVDAIKKMASEQGNRPLTIPEAKQVVKLGAEWIATRTDGILPNPKHLEADSFALSCGIGVPRPDYDPETNDPLKHPVVLKHYQNYQDYPYSEHEARRILGFYNDPYFGQVAWGSHQAFINLDNTNTATSNNPDFKPNGLQYLGTEAFPAGVAVIPFDAFRSVFQHESFHLDGDFTGMHPLDPEIALYLERQTGRNSGIIYDGLIGNFGVHVWSSNEPEVKEYTKLNELITDHLAGRLSQEANLPWWMAYERQPVDHYNLRMVFDQAGITFPELYRIYRNGLLREFYSVIAEGAGGKLFTSSSSIQDKFDFAIPRFPWEDFPVWNPESANQAKPNIIRFFPRIELPRAA